jgi:hypothetical protein
MEGLHSQMAKINNHVVVTIREEHCGCPCRACRDHISQWIIPITVEPLVIEGPINE